MFQGRTILMVGLSLFMAATVHAKTEVTEFPAVPGEFIVKLKNPKLLESKSTLMAFNSTNVRIVTKESGALVVRRPVGENRAYSMEMLANNPLVEYVEPNYIYRIVGSATDLPNDPQLNKLWGLINEGQKSNGDGGTITGLPGFDINARKAWALETGSKDVRIAVIDTGINYNLDDIKDNIWTNEVELNGQPGVDDDGNGCIDDIHGCDFANNDGDPMDGHGHGSHVTGTIAASANNGKDIVGVAWHATVVGIKFLTDSGSGSLENAIKAIDYATKLGVHMTSNSWGGGGRSEALLEAIQRAEAAGILFIAAAGNSSVNMDTRPQYPAGYDVPNIISVAAVDNAGNLASFSNYGRSVHIAAPGVNILSTTPRGLQSWSGTSMACPHVSGVAALVYSHFPNMNYSEVKDRILASARPTASIRGKVATGMLDAYYALSGETPPADPNDPTGWDRTNVTFESAHPYADNFTQTFEVSVEGASKMAIHFSRFETEGNYDFLHFYDRDGNKIGSMSGTLGENVFSPVLFTDYVKVVFQTDRSNTGFGFIADSVAYQ
ncbi:MAG: subtilase [Bdellovibrionaceae bacterium]|nr:subtilase [Pseudobdellovibrionaceae bacterium]|tara:strand:- start:5942 stop:7594 length:1653 start_codon:yes stop_codon:yes gene_type:complete